MLGRLAVPVAVFAVVTAGALLSTAKAQPDGANRSLRPSHFTDREGDSGRATDIVSVDVALDVLEHDLWITINYTGGGQFTDAGYLKLDVDQNPATGEPGTGAEFDLIWSTDGGQSEDAFRQWDSTRGQFVVVTTRHPGFGWGSHEASLRINPVELGSPRAFNFSVGTAHANGDTDRAPDGGQWTYELRSEPLGLHIERASTRPKRPHAGRSFRAAIFVARTDTGWWPYDDAKAGCRATAGGRALRGSGTYRDGFVCTWLVPKGTRGKRLTATVTATFRGASTSRTFRMKIL